MTTFAISQVDAFTDILFSGNPAGVCILHQAQSNEWMQSVAREMNLAETAFVLPRNGGYSLRWFTPAVEVDLCGHATLASAHILWESGMLGRDQRASFHTKSGVLTAECRGEWITLDFPATPADTVAAPEGLREALGVPFRNVGKSKFDLIVELDSERAVRALQPDIRQFATYDVRGIIVTAKGESEQYDFVSRFFGPAVGIDEDPVTGSAHCCLGPYWQARLGKDSFTAYQASSRGGVVKVSVAGDRVLLSGQAVTVFRGELVG